MTRRIPRLILLLTLILGVFLSTVAQAGSSLSDIVNRGELRVGTTGSQPPFSMKDKEGNFMGYEIDLAILLGEAMGVKVTFVEKTFAQLLPALEKGEIDVIMSGMTMTPKRNLKVAFVGPYMVSGKSILTKESTIDAVDETTEINAAGVTLAALKGSTSQVFVETLLPEAQLTTTDNYDQAVQLLVDDQVKAVVADYPICLLSVMRHPEAGFATLAQPLNIEPIGMAVAPDDPLLVNMVENYFTALLMVGVLEALEVAWFEDGSWLIRLP